MLHLSKECGELGLERLHMSVFLVFGGLHLEDMRVYVYMLELRIPFNVL